MSKVNKLLAKALSTSSEEEALSALRLARKNYTGGEVDADSDSWKEKARELHKAAKDWKAAAEYYKQRYLVLYSSKSLSDNQVTRYQRKMFEEQGKRRDAEDKVRMLQIAVTLLTISTGFLGLVLLANVIGG